MVKCGFARWDQITICNMGTFHRHENNAQSVNLSSCVINEEACREFHNKSLPLAMTLLLQQLLDPIDGFEGVGGLGWAFALDEGQI